MQAMGQGLRPIWRLATIIALSAMQGCSWVSRDGTQMRTLVLGLGVVSTPRHGASGDHETVSAQRVEIIGVVGAAGPPLYGVVIGRLDQQQVHIAPDANVLVSAESGRSSGFRVTVRSVNEPGEPSPHIFQPSLIEEAIEP